MTDLLKCPVFFLIDLKQSLVSLEQGDRAGEVEFELKCEDDLLFQIDQVLLIDAASLAFG